MIAQYTIVVATLNANVGVLGPLWPASTRAVRRHGRSSWQQALGTIAGAGVAALVRVKRPVLVAVLATFPAAVPIALLAGQAPVSLIAVAMLCAGIASDIFAVLWVSTIQREIPSSPFFSSTQPPGPAGP